MRNARRELSGKPHASSHTARIKQMAVEFLQLVVAGRIDEAYETFVDMQGRHHNPFFPQGFPALQRAMVENHMQFQTKRLTIKQVLGDGELVAVHSHLELRPGENGMSVVHIFRFLNDRIVELWDCGQTLPSESPNLDGAF